MRVEEGDGRRRRVEVGERRKEDRRGRGKWREREVREK